MDRAAWYEWTWLFVTDPEEVRRRVKRDPELLEVRGLWGESPMMFLAVEGQSAAVLLALDLGADPNAQDKFGVSALQSCVGLSRSGRDLSSIISGLIARGADPYHFCETRACAWHLSRKNLSKGVQANFKDMPPPATAHEKCELMTLDWYELEDKLSRDASGDG